MWLFRTFAQFGMTPLMYATMFGKRAAMEMLLKRPGGRKHNEILIRNIKNQTLLHLAAIAGRPESLDYLLTFFPLTLTPLDKDDVRVQINFYFYKC